MLIRKARQQEEEAKSHRKNCYTLNGGIRCLTATVTLPTVTGGLPPNISEESILTGVCGSQNKHTAEESINRPWMHHIFMRDCYIYIYIFFLVK